MSMQQHKVAIVGGGPAGLMAAEMLSQAGMAVTLFDAMPSVGRKFLQAGRGGLNLTHSEPFPAFLGRYGERADRLAPLLSAFDGEALRAWARELGIDTFVGSSGRVFPSDMKAAPLLRAWLVRLRSQGVSFHLRHRFLGWHQDGGLRFTTPEGEVRHQADAVVLALGGGSWARLGSDGAWVPLLAERGIAVAPLKPANCGFEIAWSDAFRQQFAGTPLKTVVLSHSSADGRSEQRQGECVITRHGVEGSLIYGFAARLRDDIDAQGSALIHLDLAPGKSEERVLAELRARGSKSLTSQLKSRVGIDGVKAGLLRELLDKASYSDPVRLAAAIKALPLRLNATRPMDEAISTAGGVCFEALDERLMLTDLPGVFCAGEMLDWEAPTGGYLLSACFASGRAAGLGARAWLKTQATP